MAEILGATASVATLTNLVVKLGKAVHTYRNAAEDGQTLWGELKGLEYVLQRVGEVCQKIPQR